MSQCEYILDNGERCKRQAQSGSKFCWQHQPSKALLKRRLPATLKQNSEKLYFSLLPGELFDLLFLYFDSHELLDILPEIEKIATFSKLFISEAFWKEIWKRDISSLRSFLSPLSGTENPYEKYKEIFSQLSKLRGNDKMRYLAKNGYDRLLTPLLTDLYDYNDAMIDAASGGQMEIVNLMLSLGADDYNLAMINAAMGGHINIVRLMLEKGATNYDSTMALAARAGHIEIVKLMLEKGATDYNWALAYARDKKYKEIVELLKSYL